MTITAEALQEAAEIRALAREFAQAELRPHTERWDHEAALPDALVAQLAELGFLGMRIADEHGGTGFGDAAFAAAIEELAWGEAAVATLVVAHAAAAAWLADHGGENGQRLLPALAGGQVATTAVMAGGMETDAPARWLARPQQAHVAVYTDGTQSHAATLEGAHIAPPHATMGLRPLAIADARPADGSIIASAAASNEDRTALLGAAAVATGIASAALEHALAYAAEREQFGRAIRTFEGVASRLSEMHIRTAAARALVSAVAADPDMPVSPARVFAADVAMWVTTQAVQIFGGYGYMRDYPVEKLMRDAKAVALLFAENDALRSRIAESLYRG